MRFFDFGHSRRFCSSVYLALAIFLLATVSLLIVSCERAGTPAPGEVSTFDKVIKAGKIRCAYVIYPPGCAKDPNTGKLYGISVETIEAAGKNLDLEIEWTEEVGWGSMIEGLETDRYDLVVSGIWPNAWRAKLVDFSIPLFYSAIGVYVREGDDRFTNNLEAINRSDVNICAIDGEMSDIIARNQFPEAKRLTLPQLSDVSQLLLNVAQGKADVTFAELYFGKHYLKSNPRTIKNIAVDRPIRVFGNTVMFKIGQPSFASMLNTTLDELINAGFVDDLVTKYETFPGVLYRKACPYQSPGL